MGSSQDATIVYGWTWDEDARGELDLPDRDEDEDFDLAEVIAGDDLIAAAEKAAGLAWPWQRFYDLHPDSERMEYSKRKALEEAYRLDHAEELKAYYDTKAAISQAVKGDVLETTFAGHHDYTDPVLYVEASRVHADYNSERFDLQALAALELAHKAEWDAALYARLEAVGIPEPEASPGWLLIASYG